MQQPDKQSIENTAPVNLPSPNPTDKANVASEQKSVLTTTTIDLGDIGSSLSQAQSSKTKDHANHENTNR